MTPDTADNLIGNAAQLGVALSDEQVKKLERYLELLGEWSRSYNLTAVKDPQDQVSYHLLDSLSVLHWIEGDAVADVGTGAGLPGVPLAIADPARHYTLVDATAKKTRFLRHVCRSLSLENVEVVTRRLEDYRPQTGFDTVVARALAPLPKLMEITGHLLAADGIMLSMKGRDPEQETQRLGDPWKIRGIHRVDVPGLQAERHIVVVIK
ncbi:MAG: 16S rRNA (guanine(527)-N(7))-methyltransferase RsmG [Gammaproteobacteria bacterium]|nr:16S rRNA (guanine(527)-N(7))-methyltransferase RsmG [Gammaproteobacteria bacterium]